MAKIPPALIGENVRKALESFFRQAAQMRQVLADVAQMVAIGGKYESVMKGLNEAIKGALSHLRETLARAEILGTLGWTVPLHATPGEYEALVSGITDVASADAAFTDYYTAEGGIRFRDLKEKLLACDDLDQWKPVLQEAILNLEEGRYRSCIALMLPLVEGVTAVKFSTPQFQKKRERDKFFAAKLEGAEAGSLEGYLWRSYKGFTEMLFQSVDFDGPSRKPVLLNRHYLLHGRGIPDANLGDCLRLFQAVDTITALPG